MEQMGQCTQDNEKFSDTGSWCAEEIIVSVNFLGVGL
jgi:hypothetical protein